MAPNAKDKHEEKFNNENDDVSENEPIKYEMKLKWVNITLMSILHLAAAYGCYLEYSSAKAQSIFFTYVIGTFGGFGITAGAHRLWCHRAYKARLPLRIFLMLCNSLSLQNDIFTWSRDHRMHHKFSETDADPHNSRRGFFFSHVGWLLCKKHPEINRKGRTMDFSDLLNDPVVAFQKKFYIPLVLLMCFAFPTVIPAYFWNENAWTALFVCGFYRYCYTLHCTWFVNSVAHLWGMKQYDQSIMPTETSFVTYCTNGEGYHNYHHVFPYDYSASELGWKYNFNLSTFFIDLCAKVGLAYDLRRVPAALVANRVQRTGDKELHHKVATRAKTELLSNTIAQITFGTCHLWIPLLIRQWTFAA